MSSPRPIPSTVRALAALLLVAALAVTVPGATQAATLTVAANAVAINSDSTCSLREAIQNANDNANTNPDCVPFGMYGADTIELATNSTYTLPDGPFTADGANGLPSITDALTINAHGSIIQRDAMAGTNFRVLRVASGISFTLTAATVRNGHTSGTSGFAGKGGGLLDRGSSIIDGSTFTNNTAANGGAAAFAEARTSTITNSTFGPNNTADEGGAIFNGEPHVLNISGTSISGNAATSEGGGITNFAVVNTTCTTISDNTALFGGGIYEASTGEAQLLRSTVSGNHATGLAAFSGNGGGIYNSGSNFGATGNDGLYVIDSTVSGNDAVANGGGIFNDSGNVFLFSSTIANNRADSDMMNGGSGGGIANSGSSFNVGMSVFTFPARINFGNAILADNSDNGNGANECIDLQMAPLITQIDSYGNNLIEDPVGCSITEIAGIGTNITGQDPDLKMLAVEAGACSATQCPAAGPAIDGGATSMTGCAGGVNSEVTVDQRGLPRPFNGICDIGACEIQPPPVRATAPAMSDLGIAILVLLLSAAGVAALRRVEPAHD